MTERMRVSLLTIAAIALVAYSPCAGQPEDPPRRDPIASRRPPGRGPGGFGGPGGPMGPERKLLKKFDNDGDNLLNANERAAAREFLKEDNEGRPMRGMRPPFGMRDEEEATPGPRVSPGDVTPSKDTDLYSAKVLRTLFLTFENEDWEKELAEFHNTDVDVPATLMVDGKSYKNVGVRFRGASSYFMVGEGHKRSLNISMDLGDAKQRLYGYKTLNLLNAHGDPSFMSSVLYSHIARQYIPAPKANFVRLVINGESWGVYPNVQQFNREFLSENFKTKDGARWKVSGSPMARGGLEYTGEDPEDYKARFEIKSDDNDKDWKALIELCRVLNETPIDKLQAALQPILDIDGALWFLALDNALINNDGYWTRASDYSIFRDPKGVFHLIPHDMNESFAGAMGGPGFGPGRRMFGGPGQPGMFPGGSGDPLRESPLSGDDRASPRRARPDSPPDSSDEDAPRQRQPRNARSDADRDGPPERVPQETSRRRGGREQNAPGGPGRRPAGITLDPLIGMDDASKPLRSRLLAVPALRAKYLDHVRTIAKKSLAWEHLGSVVDQFRRLIEDEIKADTRKLSSFESFKHATSDKAVATESGERRTRPSLRSFAEQRAEYLSKYQPKPSDPDSPGKKKKPARRQPIL